MVVGARSGRRSPRALARAGLIEALRRSLENLRPRPRRHRHHRNALGAPQVKSCGGPVMAHNTNTKIFLKRAGRGRKKAVLQHSPFMPYGDCEFSITAAGVVDAVDG